MKKSCGYILTLACLSLFQGCESTPREPKVQAVAHDAASQPFAELKELNWWVGNWEDADDNIDVTYAVDWDLNKSFLMQHFNVSMPGQNGLTGKQLIGWDPAQRKIRSWIFDSDGGFGTGVWSKDDNAWYVSVTFTQPKGSIASATHVYTKIDDDTYTFASINRDVDGELLPNIGPFKVVRKK